MMMSQGYGHPFYNKAAVASASVLPAGRCWWTSVWQDLTDTPNQTFYRECVQRALSGAPAQLEAQPVQTHKIRGGLILVLQDTRAADGRTTMLRYLARRLVSEEPPQAVLSTEIPHILSAPLKTSLMVQSRSALFPVARGF